jgi:citrate lyase subunit beta / citryl-CoA lyase
VAEICSAPNVARVAFGSVDLAAELGVDPNDREALVFARSALVVASAAAGPRRSHRRRDDRHPRHAEDW